MEAWAPTVVISRKPSRRKVKFRRTFGLSRSSTSVERRLVALIGRPRLMSEPGLMPVTSSPDPQIADRPDPPASLHLLIALGYAPCRLRTSQASLPDALHPLRKAGGGSQGSHEQAECDECSTDHRRLLGGNPSGTQLTEKRRPRHRSIRGYPVQLTIVAPDMGG